MSADNWSVCPRCFDNETAQRQGAIVCVKAIYGQVPIEEFDRQRQELQPLPTRDGFVKDFREDYEFYGAESGELIWRYRGRCKTCGLATEVDDKQRFYTPDVPLNESERA